MKTSASVHQSFMNELPGMMGRCSSSSKPCHGHLCSFL